MSNPQPKLLDEKKSIVKIGGPRRVRQATLQAETFWPGKLGADISLRPEKYPNMKMLWIPGDGLLLEWEDGSTYTIPAANIKGMEHYHE